MATKNGLYAAMHGMQMHVLTAAPLHLGEIKELILSMPVLAGRLNALKAKSTPNPCTPNQCIDTMEHYPVSWVYDLYHSRLVEVFTIIFELEAAHTELLQIIERVRFTKSSTTTSCAYFALKPIEHLIRVTREMLEDADYFDITVQKRLEAQASTGENTT